MTRPTKSFLAYPSKWAYPLGHYESCRLLLEWGGDSNAVGPQGRSPFQQWIVPPKWGRESSYLDCIRLLVEQGHADPMLEDYSGRNAYHAISRNSQSSVMWLVQHEGIAFDSHHRDGIAQKFLQSGVDPHALTRDGDTPTSIAMRHPLTFLWWRHAILMARRDANILTRFVQQEFEQSNKLSNHGWNQGSLLALFRAEIPGRLRTECGCKPYNNILVEDFTVWHQLLVKLNPFWPIDHRSRKHKDAICGFCCCKLGHRQHQSTRRRQRIRIVRTILRKRWNCHQQCWQWEISRTLPGSLQEYRLVTLLHPEEQIGTCLFQNRREEYKDENLAVLPMWHDGGWLRY
ncbi:MAG: hypothetical protein M1812_007219 [Candelaria pacifica]|nr:MAG: hypothetical protein M1812_007219 [Candelaria pacifica]